MRGALFRRQLWLACALLALTSADGCDLNPQPLPPTPSTPGGFTTGNPGDGASSGGPMNNRSCDNDFPALTRTRKVRDVISRNRSPD